MTREKLNTRYLLHRKGAVPWMRFTLLVVIYVSLLNSYLELIIPIYKYSGLRANDLLCLPSKFDTVMPEELVSNMLTFHYNHINHSRILPVIFMLIETNTSGARGRTNSSFAL